MSPYGAWIEYGNCMLHSHMWPLEKYKGLAPLVIPGNKIKEKKKKTSLDVSFSGH